MRPGNSCDRGLERGLPVWPWEHVLALGMGFLRVGVALADVQASWAAGDRS